MSETTNEEKRRADQDEFPVSIVDFTKGLGHREQRLAEAFRRVVETSNTELLTVRETPTFWRGLFDHFKAKPADVSWATWRAGRN
ncbi:MAG: hypothetical protein HY816_19995 [Candidatus Wallbacteria bacterium]|nr:hypothetical protein [Candidatus Wallbacteria bacterium]